MVWPQLKILWHDKDNSAGGSDRCKKERKTDEEMGRYFQDNIKEWKEMEFRDSPRAAEEKWNGIVATSSVLPGRPPRLRD